MLEAWSLLHSLPVLVDIGSILDDFSFEELFAETRSAEENSGNDISQRVVVSAYSVQIVVCTKPAIKHVKEDNCICFGCCESCMTAALHVEQRFVDSVELRN